MYIRREQYYWMRYWYWVILGCFRNIAIGIAKGLSKYLCWVLLRAFQSIGIGIRTIVKTFSKYWYWCWVLLRQAFF